MEIQRVQQVKTAPLLVIGNVQWRSQLKNRRAVVAKVSAEMESPRGKGTFSPGANNQLTAHSGRA